MGLFLFSLGLRNSTLHRDCSARNASRTGMPSVLYSPLFGTGCNVTTKCHESRRVTLSDVAIPAVGSRSAGEDDEQTQAPLSLQLPNSWPVKFPLTVMPQSELQQLTVCTLARLVDRFADGDLSSLLADDKNPPPCPELASALDASDASTVRCNSCKSMPRLQDESCMQCLDLRQFRSQFEALQSRFLSYFFWPAVLDSEELTNIAPVYKTIKRPKKNYQRKRPVRRTWVSKRWAEARLQKAEEEAAAAAGTSSDGNALEDDSVADDAAADDAVTDDTAADNAVADGAVADSTGANDTEARNAASNCVMEGDSTVAEGLVDVDMAEVVATTNTPAASAVVADTTVITTAEVQEAGVDEAAQGIGVADRQEDIDMTEEEC